MRVHAAEASVTISVDGVTIQTATIRDIRVAPERRDYERLGVDGCSYNFEFTVERADGLFEELWYEAMHHPDALDRWADDGGAVPW